jgi:F0F1-type ATP synthase assembly protein I
MSADPLQPEKKTEADTSPWGFALSIGWELVVSVLGGFLIGQWLDKKWKTSPWLMLSGALFGITVALYRLIKLANERQKKR